MINASQTFLEKHKWGLILLLLVIFGAALAIRVYDLSDLPLDFHAARQLQSMTKARGMYYENVSDAPEWKRAFAIEQWKATPTQEPEIAEHLAAFTYGLLGEENIWFPRFYSVVYWLLGGVGLFLLLRRWVSIEGALIGLCFFLFAPCGIEASRAFMPDPLMLALLIWACWALLRWSERPGWGRAVLAGLLFGLTVYVKLTAVFYAAGVILGLSLGQLGFKKAIKTPQLWLIGLLALIPGGLYNLLGIFVFKFIRQDAVENRIVPAMLADPLSYLNWNNMIGIVVGFAAFLLALAGIFLLKERRARSLTIGLWAGYLLFGLVFIYYYTSHDYYHLVTILMVSIGLAAIGDAVAAKMLAVIQPGWFAQTLLLLVIGLGVFEVCWQVRSDFKRVDYRPQAAFWQMLGEKLNNTSSLAMTEDYNARLAYWGWYASSNMPDVAELRHRELTGHGGDAVKTFKAAAEGKEYFLVTQLNDFDQLPDLKSFITQTYPIFDQGDGYIIFDLRQ